ncbi:putative mitochondrial ATPase inhibitor, IATP [Lyophyllum shimeji]|uniref:ATPase inhibitor, mitochondrial n=1 Tax=Lyophyllum shimeji TaxID=47721 RepID=A0A9P3Q0F4_LYOSH|nr:putative mitochondrial ATPase inhibitor, IATP [Lyophyllum shimeji]
MLARLSAVRAVPRLVVVPVRYTSNTEGGVAQGSKAFSKKEKAAEDQYVHQHEMELLAKMKAEIEKKKVELDALEKKQAELEQKKEEKK